MAAVALMCISAAAAAFYFSRSKPSQRSAMAGIAPDILNQLPADAPGVAYIDVAALRKLQNSPLAAFLGIANSNPAEDRDYREFVRSTGFDYTRDLYRVAVAFWPAAFLARSSSPAAKEIIVAAEGRFDEQKIDAYALHNGKMETRGAQSIYEIPGPPPTSFEFLSPTRIRLASGNGAATLLGGSDPDARDRVVEDSVIRVAGAPVFAVARTDNLPPSVYENFRSYPELGQMARNIQRVTLAGQPAGDLFFLVLEGECDSTQNATEISTLLESLRMLGSMSLLDPKTRAQMTPQEASLFASVLKEVKITHEDRFVRLMLDVTPEMLGQAGQASSRATH